MRAARFLAPWKDSAVNPAICHCISRAVDRRFVFGDAGRGHFRMFMRMHENFSGCRVLSYCIMSNHFHILLEVPSMAEGGISDEAVIGSKGFVNEAFAGARERFTAERKDGARRMRGAGAPAAGALWSMRDLRVRI